MCIYLLSFADVFYGTLAYSQGPTFGNKDIGEDVANRLFASNSVFYRVCPSCIVTHQFIIYKRISPIPASFSIYSNMVTLWTSANNTLGHDFNLYSTWKDFARGINAWLHCDYDVGVSFPWDCAPAGGVPDQWNSLKFHGGASDYAFSVAPL